MDPLGNIPFYISVLKEIPVKRQRQVILRELLIALFVIVLFHFVGEHLLDFLGISQDTVQIAGGLILFLISLRLIFPNPGDEEKLKLAGEPFIVPLAIPLVAGPSVLAAVMIYSRQIESTLVMIIAIILAWAASLIILLSSPTLGVKLGKKGIIACERLMGLILTFLAVQMFLTGVSDFFAKRNNSRLSENQLILPKGETNTGFSTDPT